MVESAEGPVRKYYKRIDLVVWQLHHTVIELIEEGRVQ